MSKFRQNKSKEMPGVSTASLPDIVFTVLAFFVVVSSMKQSDLKVEITKPTGKEIIQLDKNEGCEHLLKYHLLIHGFLEDPYIHEKRFEFELK